MTKHRWQLVIAYVVGGLTFGYVVGIFRGARGRR